MESKILGRWLQAKHWVFEDKNIGKIGLSEIEHRVSEKQNLDNIVYLEKNNNWKDSFI